MLNISNVRQRKIHATEPLVTGSGHPQVEIAISNLKKYKSQGSDHILTELSQAGSERLVSARHRHINFILNTKELPEKWKGSNIVPVHKQDDKTNCNNFRGI
jgi:hypothetical protein